jgi:dolichyl-phosphate beta-glucosyltransferase
MSFRQRTHGLSRSRDGEQESADPTMVTTTLNECDDPPTVAAEGRTIGTLRRLEDPQLEIIIPTLNEQQRIGPTLAIVCAYLCQLPFTSRITVVDNGSVDLTPDVVRRWSTDIPVRLIGCSRTGKGAAVKVGIMAATAQWVGFCDADLATPIGTLASVVSLLEAGHPVVIGSRRCYGASYQQHQPLLRRTAGWVFRRATRSIADGISDTQCGFKFFDRATAQQLFRDVTATGFTFDLELLAVARRYQVPVAEVPVEWTHQKGSSLRIFEHGFEVLREVRNLRRHGAVSPGPMAKGLASA